MQVHTRPPSRSEALRPSILTPCGLAGGNFEQHMESPEKTLPLSGVGAGNAHLGSGISV